MTTREMIDFLNTLRAQGIIWGATNHREWGWAEISLESENWRFSERFDTIEEALRAAVEAAKKYLNEKQ